MGLLGRAGLEEELDAAEGENTPESSILLESVKRKIRKYQRGSSFYGIVFEAPGGQDGKEFKNHLAHITAFFGGVIFIPPRRTLLLFSKHMDSELIAHRLSRTLKTSPVTVFEAENPDQAVAHIFNPR